MKPVKMAFTALLVSFCFGMPALAQPTRMISEDFKKEIVSKSMALLKENYVFPEKVPAMEKQIQKNLAAGKYQQLTTVEQFLRGLNVDLETLSNDRHVDIFFDPVRVQQIEKSAQSSSDAKPSYAPAFLNRVRFENSMVRKVERLEANVGYLKMDLFIDLELSKPTLVAAMNFLKNSDAVIIDLRRNGGGHASTVNFLVNYFLPDSTLTSEFTSRLTKTTTAIYTEHDPVIEKFNNDIPVYVLVSKRTSSAAEAFAYILQAFKRAVIIGDTTNGEANPGFAFALNKEMWMMIPTSVNRNAITKTNWQGVGVIPDFRIAADSAFLLAQAKAYQHLASDATKSDRKYIYQWKAEEMAGTLNPARYTSEELRQFTGAFKDNRNIELAGTELFYYRNEVKNRKRLVPMTRDVFALEGLTDFRIRIIRNAQGAVIAMEGYYDDDQVDRSDKL